MRYFANPSTQIVRDAMAAGLISMIITPAQGNRIIPGVPWCADNGCFGAGYPGDEKWFAWLAAKTAHVDTCVFAVAPDVVGDAAATLLRSRPWLPKIRELGYPAAFVAQDGQESLEVPWDEFDVLFIGGSTDWKLSEHPRELGRQAHLRGKYVHMGRVNSRIRLRIANTFCDSCDGTYIAFGPTKNLGRMLGWLSEVASTPPESTRRAL